MFKLALLHHIPYYAITAIVLSTVFDSIGCYAICLSIH